MCHKRREMILLQWKPTGLQNLQCTMLQSHQTLFHIKQNFVFNLAEREPEGSEQSGFKV